MFSHFEIRIFLEGVETKENTKCLSSDGEQSEIPNPNNQWKIKRKRRKESRRRDRRVDFINLFTVIDQLN